MRTIVVVATVGRAELTRRTVARLAFQSRRPDGVMVVGASPEDVAGVAAPDLPLRVELGRKGLCSQRNHALDRIENDYDLIAMFDDDFVPAFDLLERAAAYFEAHPDVVGVNGQLIADGARGPGVSFAEACRLLDAHAANPPPPKEDAPLEALYGCNMILRASAIRGMRFDENLPLYAWQEDIDFTYRLKARGRLVKVRGLAGVHMGIKSGRTPGKKLGYSQIANPIYLLKKKTIPGKLALKLLVKGPVANLLKFYRPEPYIDRRGRLIGNLIALWDLALGRMDPRRIVDLT